MPWPWGLKESCKTGAEALGGYRTSAPGYLHLFSPYDGGQDWMGCGMLPCLLQYHKYVSVLDVLDLDLVPWHEYVRALDVCICGIERQKEEVCLLSTSVQRSVRDDVFHRAWFMTVTQAGLCRGVAWPRTRGRQQEDDLQETSQEKKRGEINTCSRRVTHNYTWHVDNRQLLC